MNKNCPRTPIFLTTVVVSLRQKRPPSGEERGEKSVAIFEKKKKCKGSTFVAQKTSAYIIFFRPHRVIN